MYLTQSLHRALQQFPDRPMTVCGDRVRTTREVVERVARLASALRGLGVRTGDRVGMLALNSDRCHEFLFACWWTGAVAHPVNTRWSEREIAYAVQDSGTGVLLVDDACAPLVPGLREHCPGLRTLVHCGDGPAPEDGMVGYEELIADSDPAPDARLGGDTVGLLLYTGGTTGLPKGVMITHQGLITSLHGSILSNEAVERGGVTLLTVPMFHIAGLCGWYAQTMMGGTDVFLPSFTPEDFLEAVRRHRVTTTILVPVMVQSICEHPRFGSYDLTSLETVTYGGAGSPESLLRLAMESFPGARFTQGYGMTETGVLTMLTHEDHLAGGPRLRSAGRATPTTELAVVDPAGRPLPPGEIGEIVTRNRLMTGYWNKPEQTARALDDGWTHTGDAGRLDRDGYLYIVDRLKDMIVTGGENVYSAEVENALAAHPAVAACAVIGVPDRRWGERVHAVVTLRPGHTTTPDELRTHTRTLIARYKTPRTIDITDTLPRTAAGKILKRQLRDACADRPAD
ncbi:long-chain fatty acid--CoA ligase [Streptomyces sp. NPDC014894]|uniref:acyl-CoA synthetase n=1 Tax=Streptomyces sp. NPDC014894 TaxID=3364931 RepID=UPI0036F5D45E